MDQYDLKDNEKIEEGKIMEEGWINKIIKKYAIRRKLKDISKQMLAHNLAVKIDELKNY